MKTIWPAICYIIMQRLQPDRRRTGRTYSEERFRCGVQWMTGRGGAFRVSIIASRAAVIMSPKMVSVSHCWLVEKCWRLAEEIPWTWRTNTSSVACCWSSSQVLLYIAPPPLIATIYWIYLLFDFNHNYLWYLSLCNHSPEYCLSVIM